MTHLLTFIAGGYTVHLMYWLVARWERRRDVQA